MGVDAFNRARVNALPESLKINDWAANHPHFKQSAEFNVYVAQESDEKAQSATTGKMVISAMESFMKRCSPKLHLSPGAIAFVVDDSLEHTVQYIYSAIVFITNSATATQKMGFSLCPFQIDLCLAYREPLRLLPSDDVKDENQDEDEEYQDDDEEKSVFIGDIRAKLETNGLRCAYVNSENREVNEVLNRKVFKPLFRAFRDDHDVEETGTQKYQHRQRFVVMADRRNYQGTDNCEDDVWLYEPPQECRVIPRGAVSEWYLNASRTSLLPPDIGSLSEGMTGSLMTLSFHVHSVDVIKCYLYFGGQIIRFMPSDIKNVLPRLFNMDFPGNAEFVKSKLIDEYAEAMARMLMDCQFEAFKRAMN